MDALLSEFRFDVRWGDLDAFGHVNNARFHTYIEEARLQWLQSLSAPWQGEDFGPLLAAVTMNFRQPLGWPENVRLLLGVERIGNSSLTLAHRLLSASDAGRVYADGTAVMVWIDRRSGRPDHLPDAVRTAAGAALAGG